MLRRFQAGRIRRPILGPARPSPSSYRFQREDAPISRHGYWPSTSRPCLGNLLWSRKSRVLAAISPPRKRRARSHTLFIGTNGTQTINQSLYRHLAYDPASDFTPIGMMWSAPHLVVIHPAIPARSLDAFITYVRARPGEFSFGSS